MPMVTSTPLTIYPSIIVKSDPSADPYFALAVAEALKKINSKGTGMRMLSDIEAADTPAPYGYKVAIMKKGVSDITDPMAGSSGVTPCNHSAATDSTTTGSASVLKWISSQWKTPDGMRPPFIGLAHELVHCWHNSQGSSVYDKDTNELATVGLKGNWTISENAIREEHGIALRTTYSGVSN